MRIRLKGINSVRKTLADGSVKVFYYAWKSGPPLQGEPGSREFVASYNNAVARKVQLPEGTLQNLLRQFQASPDFTGLADSTRRSYIALIKRIEAKFSDFPLSALRDRRTRGIFKGWRDAIADSSGHRQADYTWSVLARVLSWGLDRGIIAANPCERGGRLYRASRNEKIWTADDEANLLWTGQRQGDLLRLPWSAYNGTHISLRQSKTGNQVVIPVGGLLKTMLDAAPRVSTMILTNTDNKPWTSDGFRASWRKACASAEVRGVTFHDLRGTTVTRLALAGASNPEIATVTGLSLKTVRAMLDAHYLHRDPALAESAIRKLERRTKTPN